MTGLFGGQYASAQRRRLDNTGLNDEEGRAWAAKLGETLQRNLQWAKEGPYETVLTPEDERAFRQWVAESKAPINLNDPVQDYDMRGFWSALRSGDPDATTAINPNDHRMHFPDRWKTPFHETFSRQSQYATPNAPYWLDDRYLVAPDGSVLFDDKAKR